MDDDDDGVEVGVGGAVWTMPGWDPGGEVGNVNVQVHDRRKVGMGLRVTYWRRRTLLVTLVGFGGLGPVGGWTGLRF